MPIAMFACKECKKSFYHPDDALDCELSHGDVSGYCIKCDFHRAFSKVGDRFVCKDCGNSVQKVYQWDAICRDYASSAMAHWLTYHWRGGGENDYMSKYEHVKMYCADKENK